MNQQHPKYITPQQAAEHLPIGAPQVINYIKNRKLKAIKNPLDERKYLIEWESFQEFRSLFGLLDTDSADSDDPETEPEPASRQAS